MTTFLTDEINSTEADISGQAWYVQIMFPLNAGYFEDNFGSISVSGQLRTYPSPNPTVTLTF